MRESVSNGFAGCLTRVLILIGGVSGRSHVDEEMVISECKTRGIFSLFSSNHHGIIQLFACKTRGNFTLFSSKHIKSIIEIIYKFYILVEGQKTILVFFIVADKTKIVLNFFLIL